MRKKVIYCGIFLIIFTVFHVLINLNGYNLESDITSIYINIINAFAIIILTLEVYDYNKKKDEIDFKSKTPLISIIQEDYTGRYQIQNIGGGPALNVRILSDLDDTMKFWRKNIIAYDLFGSKIFNLDEINKEQYLITYNDIYNTNYYSYMKDNHLLFGSVNSSDEHIRKMLYYEKGTEIFCNIQVPSV